MITQCDRWIMRLRSIPKIYGSNGNFLLGPSVSAVCTPRTDRN